MNHGRLQGKRSQQKRLAGVDFSFLFLALALLAFGLIMVLSSGAVRGYNLAQNSYYFISQQLKWAALGGGLAIVATVVPYAFWRKFAGIGIVLTLGLLVLVLYTDKGIITSGSARWLKFAGINVQPSEIAKLTLILFYAHIFERYPIKTGKDLVIPGVVLLPMLYLVYKQPDLGTMLVLALTSVAMLLQTELPTRWFAWGGPLLGAAGFYLVRHTDYQWKRILVWLDPWAYATTLGYQITNAEIAFGSGGLFGVGLGRSLQKYGFLPENHTDTIFAIVGEELGLLGTTALLVLFVLLIIRGYKIARACPERFGRLLAFGLISSLAIQACMNFAVVTGVLPMTGITLPLISYGGNSLLITMVELGLLLNISRHRELAILLPEKKQPNISV
ncbi:MAG: putative lipid II flippase FtsW [Desulfitobacteriaceae bacterium]